MTIYVDRLRQYGAQSYHGQAAAQAARVGARSGHQWCHLFSDAGEAELHAFAARIGLRRAWYQGDHYDLTPNRREAAVRAGALPATDELAASVWRAARVLRLLETL